MNLNCYRYVISIAENASISKAAKDLFISQPALTKYLNKLEEELGVRLFDRTVNPIRITYAGLFLFNRKFRRNFLLNKKALRA